jgi:hypothetical protein
MPAPTVDQGFITKFEKDVHLEYRLMSSKLRGLVRTDADVNGSTARFYKLGTVVASTKARNGEIPLSNPNHSFVTATMADRYAALMIDKLDLTKMNEDLRTSYVKAMVAAFAQPTDNDILTAMNGSTTTVTVATNLVRGDALAISEKLDTNYVPRDGRRFCAITPHAWSFLMSIDQFVRSDYVGPDDLPFKKQGISVRTWNDLHWFVHPGLTGVGTAAATCFAWHYDSVGHGINSDIETTWDWENLSKAWSCAGSMSMGAALINTAGVVKFNVNDTTALP